MNQYPPPNPLYNPPRRIERGEFDGLSYGVGGEYWYEKSKISNHKYYCSVPPTCAKISLALSLICLAMG